MSATLQRKPVDTRAFLICVVLCFIWGLQQVAIKAAADDFSTLLQVGVRSGISFVLLYLYNHFFLHEKMNPDVKWVHGLLVGLCFSAEFVFVAEGIRYTSVAHMSVLLYTAPLFAAIGLSIRLPEERLSAVQWGGLLFAFFGLAIAFLLPVFLSGTSHGATDLWWFGDLLGLLSGVAWGMTTVFLRTTSMTDAVPTQMLYWQLGVAFLTLTPLSFLMGEAHFESTTIAWSSLLFQAVIVSFASYLIWCGLLRRYLAARLGVIVFLSPLFGVILSIVLLGETVGLPFVVGSLCVLLGLIAVQGDGHFRKLFSWRRIGSGRTTP